MTAIDILLLILLTAVCVGGALLTVLQLPGTWVIVAAVLGYAWYYGWTVIGPWMVAALAGVALVAEATEMAASLWLAHRGGASRRAMWWGMIGGLCGALLLSIPVPLVGTIIGAAIGCFAGALLAELSQRRGLAAGARGGFFAAVGRTIGTIMKVAAAVVMAGVAVLLAATQGCRQVAEQVTT